ncbi:hypothetical protein M5689_024911 [Euphorbia peplus]|nr:hypothetical protein M5689_024911 [Euphorbia peplus]
MILPFSSSFFRGAVDDDSRIHRHKAFQDAVFRHISPPRASTYAVSKSQPIEWDAYGLIKEIMFVILVT